mmetsp:Transcript_27707/g.81437  ORF Transcript_27707/g.81437 Transcript_27707/m.81437 type:complete len:234 (-) Transcript_27707:418-1119(-)
MGTTEPLPRTPSPSTPARRFQTGRGSGSRPRARPTGPTTHRTQRCPSPGLSHTACARARSVQFGSERGVPAQLSPTRRPRRRRVAVSAPTRATSGSTPTMPSRDREGRARAMRMRSRPPCHTCPSPLPPCKRLASGRTPRRRDGARCMRARPACAPVGPVLARPRATRATAVPRPSPRRPCPCPRPGPPLRPSNTAARSRTLRRCPALRGRAPTPPMGPTASPPCTARTLARA